MIKQLNAQQLSQVGGGNVFENSMVSLACATVTAGACAFLDIFKWRINSKAEDLGSKKVYSHRCPLGVLGAVIGLLIGDFLLA